MAVEDPEYLNNNSKMIDVGMKNKSQFIDNNHFRVLAINNGNAFPLDFNITLANMVATLTARMDIANIQKKKSWPSNAKTLSMDA